MKVACVILALLAAVSLGAAIADIIYTVVVVCPKTTDVCPLGNLAIIFSYIGSGVWASLFVFITAIFGLRYVGDPRGSRQTFVVVCFLAAVIFTPAMTILNSVGAYMVLTETPGVSLTEELYDIDKPSDGFMVKFYLPVALAALGLIEFFVTSGLLIYVCLKTPRQLIEEPESDLEMPPPSKGVVAPVMPPAPRDPRSPVMPPAARAPFVPRQGPMSAPGYYYPSRVYDMPAGYPMRNGGAAAAYGGRSYYY